MLGQRGCSDVQVQAITQRIVFYILVENAHDTYMSVTDSDKLGDTEQMLHRDDTTNELPELKKKENQSKFKVKNLNQMFFAVLIFSI